MRPRMVAIATACSAGSTVGSPVVTFCRSAARFISSIRSKSLLLPAGPSVPRPTGMPSARSRTTGAMPLASFMLLDGQCATPVPCAFRIFASAASSLDGVRDDGPAVQNAERFHQPRRRHVACAQRVVSSVLVSARCITSGAWNLLASCARGLQIGVVIGVDGVRGDGGSDDADRPGTAREISR